MMHLAKFFRLGKRFMSKNANVGILPKINFFRDSARSVGVLKWLLALQIV